MMDIFFKDPAEIPLPPQEVRIRKLNASPWPDGRRVRIFLEVDPFQRRPSADATILDPAGNLVAQVSVVETQIRKMEFNMHLREAIPGSTYTVQAVLYYDQTGGEAASGEEDALQRLVVDQAETTFETPVGSANTPAEA